MNGKRYCKNELEYLLSNNRELRFGWPVAGERVGLEIRRPKYFFKKQIDKGILPKYVNMEQL